MQQATDPAGDHMPRHLACSQSVAVAGLRPKIAHSRALLGEAEKEPPFISRHRVLLANWRPALSALEALVTKVAALESLLEGQSVNWCKNVPYIILCDVLAYAYCTSYMSSFRMISRCILTGDALPIWYLSAI